MSIYNVGKFDADMILWKICDFHLRKWFNGQIVQKSWTGSNGGALSFLHGPQTYASMHCKDLFMYREVSIDWISQRPPMKGWTIFLQHGIL